MSSVQYQGTANLPEKTSGDRDLATVPPLSIPEIVNEHGLNRHRLQIFDILDVHLLGNDFETRPAPVG
jgi:hypothetical protein